jgi:hypothetical protein
MSEAEFYQLFAKCRCGLVMTRRVFSLHICATIQNPPEVIDLTNDDSDDSVTPGPSDIIIDLTADSEDEQQ